MCTVGSRQLCSPLLGWVFLFPFVQTSVAEHLQVPRTALCLISPPLSSVLREWEGPLLSTSPCRRRAPASTELAGRPETLPPASASKSERRPGPSSQVSELPLFQTAPSFFTALLTKANGCVPRTLGTGLLVSGLCHLGHLVTWDSRARSVPSCGLLGS